MRILTPHQYIPLPVIRHQAASSMSKPRTRKYADKAGSSNISSEANGKCLSFLWDTTNAVFVSSFCHHCADIIMMVYTI